MLKDSVVVLLQAEKSKQADAAVASVAAEFDALIEQVKGLPDDASGDVMILQAQLQDLTVKLDAANAEIAKDIAALADEKSVEEKLIAKIAAIKAALEG